MNRYLDIRNLEVSFKTFEGVKNVLDIEALSIEKGRTFGLVGESGAGKSVLAYSLLRILSSPPAIIRGEALELDGENLLEMNEREMRAVRGCKIAMIFQDPMSSLNPVFTVGDQLRNVIRKNRRLSGKALDQEVIKMLTLVQLPDPVQSARKYPHELSGGQRQRVIIALALSCDPQLLIADEPTRNLDVTIQAQILKLVVELQKKMNVTVLYIANNPALVSSICDKMGVIHKGRLIEVGTVREVMNEPKHPYTSLLLNPVPAKQEEKDENGTGRTKNLIEELEGCRFFDQCHSSLEECRKKKPKLQLLAGEHYVACNRMNTEVGR